MSNPKPLPTDEFSPREKVSSLIRDLAVMPPVKGMANVKAATDVFEANQEGTGRPAKGTATDQKAAGPTPRE